MITSYRVGLLLVCVITVSLLFSRQVTTIYGGDAGDLVSAIAVKGIPHPPGFPFFTSFGILINTLFKWGTPAWRVGFLSSIPTLLSAVFLYDLLYYLTKRSLIAVISVLTYSFTYPVWLYGIVPEVFALNNLFTILLIWCAFRLIDSRRIKFLRLLVFLFGLAVTHHHIIVFLAPALLFAVYSLSHRISRSELFKLCIIFTAGLMPLAYVFISASNVSPLNWMGNASVARFISLVSREGYGTFRAGHFAAHEFPLRILEIGAFLEFLWRDFRPAGVLLGLLGFVALFFAKRRVWGLLTIAFLSYVFFLFYASFPLNQEFMLGTFERFMLPLYLVMALFIGYGIHTCINIFVFIIQSILNKKSKIKNQKYILKMKYISLLITIFFFILPLGLFLRNYPILFPLKNDRTAENLALDILNSVEEDAIVFLSTDTPLFNTQYLYYSQRQWPRLKLIHFTKLFTPFYPAQLKKTYPEIIIPEPSDDYVAFFNEILTENSHRFPIYSKQAFTTKAGYWVPWGLLFRFYAKNTQPKSDEIYAKNDSLWQRYHDPFSGVLSTFRHLILSDVLRVYAIAHQETAFYLAQNGYDQKAQEHLVSSISLYPSDTDSFVILAQVYARRGLCDESEETIRKRSQVMGKNDNVTYLLFGLNEKLCRKNDQKANEYNKLFEQEVNSTGTKLDKLL